MSVVSGTASRRAADTGGEATLFDREDALAALIEAYRAAAEGGRLEIVTVGADAGLGKTRLLIEFETQLLRGDPAERPRVGYGRALASSSVGNGFQPMREALADLLVEEEKGGRDRLRRLWSLLKSTAPDWLEALPMLGSLLHAAAVTTQQALAGPEAPAVPDSMNAQFLAVVDQIAADRPLVLLLDDLHWADESSVDLLFFLSQQLHRPVLLVLAFRVLDLRGREDHHPLRQTLWRMQRYCTVRQVDLRPLSAASLASLAGQVLQAREPMDPDVIGWLTRASEGNPLYVQEYLWHLRELHDRAHRGPAWDFTLVRDAVDRQIDLPQTLEAVVAERLDELGYEELRVLQLAAVIGPVISPDELLALSDMGVEPTKRALRTLCQRIGLLRAAPTGYAFYHGLVREYVRHRHHADDLHDYREVHRLRADYLAERPARGLDWIEAIAYHYHEAAAGEEALIYALEAAEASKAAGAVSEAVRYLGWAVEHADRAGEAHEAVLTRCALGTGLQELIRTDAAVTALQDALQRADTVDLTATERFDLLVELAKAHRMEEQWAPARTHLAAAWAGDEQADPDRRAYLRLVTAEVHLSGNPRDTAAAETLLQQAAELTEMPRHLSGIYGHLGFIALAHDQVDASWDWFDRAHHLALASGSTGRLYETHLWRAKHHLACLHLGDAQTELDAMAELARRLGVGQTVAHHCRDTGRRHALAGEPEPAATAYAGYLSHMLDQPAWTSRAITYLLLQAREISDLHGWTHTEQLYAALLNCIGSTAELALFHQATSIIREGAAQQTDPEAGLRAAGLGRYLDTPQATAAEVIFRFHIDDLTGFRRRHGFTAAHRTGARTGGNR